VFVSHNMGAVAAMCQRGIVLEQGTVACDDDVKSAIARYMLGISSEARVPLRDRKTRRGDQRIKFCELQILDSRGQCVNIVSAGDDVVIDLEYEVNDPAVRNVAIQISFSDSMGRALFACATRIIAQNFPTLPHASRVRCHIPNLPLVPGVYRMSIFCKVDGQAVADEIEGAAEMTVASGDFFGTGKIFGAETGFPLLVHHRWEMLGSEAPALGATAR